MIAPVASTSAHRPTPAGPAGPTAPAGSWPALKSLDFSEPLRILLDPIELPLMSRPLSVPSLTSLLWIELFLMSSEPIRPAAYDVPVEATTRAMIETAMEGEGRRLGRRMGSNPSSAWPPGSTACHVFGVIRVTDGATLG